MKLYSPEDPETGRSYYSVEEAKTGRSKCKICKRKIAKDNLRIGQHVDFFIGGDYPGVYWNHVGCFEVPPWFKKGYKGDTLNRDFLSKLEDNTNEKILGNEEDLEDISERMGPKKTGKRKISQKSASRKKTKK